MTARSRDPRVWQVPLVVALSVAFESLFLRNGPNLTDEGWPLHAARLLQSGGTLYEDVFFVFPPAHLLSAWIGHAVSPPGILGSRLIYAGFNVALCVAVYLLGRRVGPPAGALLGACLLAVAAPESHRLQLLFGYRYLVFGAVALLCFLRSRETHDTRWLFTAGVVTGAGLCFRLTPAFATAVAVGVGIAVGSPPRRWLREGGIYAAGLGLVVLPVLAWLAVSVGFEVIWREVVWRPVEMTRLQQLSLPALEWPESMGRGELARAFVPVLFRGLFLLYAGYSLWLVRHALRARAGRHPFDSLSLLVVVVWGGIYLVRTLGRSDVAHLESALPPACLLLGHAVVAGATRIERHGGVARLAVPVCALVAFMAWGLVLGSDTWIGRRGAVPIASTGGNTYRSARGAAEIDGLVASIRHHVGPDEVFLDLSVSPMLHVLADRDGPGFADVVMPGAFLSAEEERRFVARLTERPPAAVVVPTQPFDRMAPRSLQMTAPELARWVRSHYGTLESHGSYRLLVPFARLGRPDTSGTRP